MWSTDGTAVWFNRPSVGIVRVELSTGVETLATTHNCTYGDLHPDETKILCSDTDSGQYRLRLLTIGGGSTLLHNATCGRWSPDGDKMMFRDRWDMAIADADGSNVQFLTTDGQFKTCGDWHPDSQGVIYPRSRPDGDHWLRTRKLDGTDVRFVTQPPWVEPDYWADWVPSM